MCNKNHNHMMSASWYIMWCTVPQIWSVKDRIFVILDHFLSFYLPHNLENQNFEKMKKVPGDILHMCTINDDHMTYGSWEIEHAREYHHFTYVYQKLWSYGVQFLRDGVQQMEGQMDGQKNWNIEVGVPPKKRSLQKEYQEKQFKNSCKTIREINNKKWVPPAWLKGANSEEKLWECFQHFKNLLCTSKSNTFNFENETPFSNKISELLPITFKLFSIHRLRKLLMSVKSSPTPGLDAIPAFLWRHQILCEDPFTKCFDSNIPPAFSTSYIKYFPSHSWFGMH